MAQTKPKATQFYGVSNNGTDGQFLKTDGTGGMSWDSPITNPTITSIDYPGSATAADPAGGESVIINGTLFASGITCTVGGTSAVTAFNSATQITITTPAKAAGQYTVAVTNTDGGTASQASFIQYSGVPVWSTAAGTLGNVLEGTSASFQVTATEGSDTIEYAVTTGTLPTGLSLATATGAITGTAPTVSANTTTTFSITATDDENQTSSERSFSITVTNDNPSNYFNTVLYTGNNSTQSITGVGFQPDFVWIKARNNGSNNHALTDSIRGTGSGNGLSSNTTGVEGEYSAAYGYLSAFGTDGFTVQAGSTSSNFVNSSSANYVAWCFKAGGAATTIAANTVGNTIASDVSVNNTLGFSIAKYAGNGISGATYAHGLDATPELVLNKVTDYNQAWWAFTPTLGANKFMQLNTIAATTTDSDYYYSVSSSLFTLNGPGNPPALNQSGKNYITYNFTSKPGFSKVGSYTGNANASGPIVDLGFEPAFLMIKNSSSTESGGAAWLMYDNKRSTSNPRDRRLYANTSSAEAQNNNYDINFLTNGFQITSYSSNYGYNNSGETYLYLAFAADPSTTTPSLANSFDIQTYAGNAGTQSITGTGFKPDIIWGKTRNAAQGGFIVDSVRGRNNSILPYSNNQDNANSSAANDLVSFDSDGFTLGPVQQTFFNSAYNQVAWLWKAGGLASINTDGTITSLVSANQAAGFSVVKYTGNSTVGATIAHGLGAKPELFFIKNLTATSGSRDWIAWCNEDNTKLGYLNYTDAFDSSRYSWALNSTQPTSTTITFSNDTSTNSSFSYIAYCFRSIPGYSKVGSYTGTGVLNTIATGFEPSWVIIKRTSGTGGWLIFDNKRNTSNPRNNRIEADTNQAEQTGSTSKFVNFNSTNLQIGGNNGELNASGDTYIYLAIKEN